VKVGDTVHYVSSGSADGHYPATCRAAMITEKRGDMRVALAVFNPTGVHFDQEVNWSAGGQKLQPRTWHERTECE